MPASSVLRVRERREATRLCKAVGNTGASRCCYVVEVLPQGAIVHSEIGGGYRERSVGATGLGGNSFLLAARARVDDGSGVLTLA